jgi:alpha-L-fucosidase
LSDSDWFASARFGLFVHWGPYSARGLEPSWPLVGGSPVFRHCQDLAVADYYAGHAEWIPPEGSPREWARAARACGMQYAVLTTKHHDGFTLFPSEHSAFGIGMNAPGRDLVREFVDACRSEDLRVGLYYSLSDWAHPDYPPFRDDMRPYLAFAYPRPEPDAWARYVADLRGQLEHLLTAYGQIDLLWFDGGWERQASEWGSPDLEASIRSWQPDIVINDRLPGVGDYESPEQSVPSPPPAGRWETCMTMNHSWGPVAEDTDRKSTSLLLSTLADVAAGGGNLLLNVSPAGDGRLLDWQRERLGGIAAWMDRHGEAILGTEAGLAPGQFYGPTTRRGASLYLLCPMRPVDQVVLRRVRGRRVEAVRSLSSGRPLEFTLQLGALDNLVDDPICDVNIAVPDADCDPTMTVLEVVSGGAGL